ncbi:MAG: hypothetical protein ACHP9Z_01465 [Streptosporangiales bacterium]
MRPITQLTGRYRLDELIAAGGMGEVWRGWDGVLARPVAVKLLRPAYADDEVTLARFRAEARHAGRLSHPGIAQAYDYAEATERSPAFLVMELVDGLSLAAVGSVVVLTTATRPSPARSARPSGPRPSGSQPGGAGASASPSPSPAGQAGHTPPGRAKHGKGAPPGQQSVTS